jgi:protease-4
MDDHRKKRGCFRTGCLTLVIGILLLAGAGMMMHFWNKRLPSRFVLKIPVTGSIDERPSDTMALPVVSARSQLTLEELLTIFDRARTDRRIESVLLQIDGVAAAPAKIQELASSIERLRKSGRKVTAFLRTPEDKDYQLAVACDTVIVEKGAWMQLDGLKSELFFFAEPLEKLGIRFDVAQWKHYKSAAESLTRPSASKENLEETSALLDDAWNDYLAGVARRRGIDQETFRQYIDSLAVVSPEKAVELHLADRVLSVRQLEKEYARRAGDKPLKELFVDGASYLAATDGMAPEGRGERIAVLAITGTITGEHAMDSREGQGTDVDMVRNALQTALDDPKVKAIVLRIDSPGGDALAASSMLEVLEEAKQRKPMVASMSGVAASGGYMVALAADTIYAQPMTITGSIGVISVKPDFSGLLLKSGIHREVLGRGHYADAFTPFKPLDAEAFRKYNDVAGAIYRDFTGKVAERRHLTDAETEAVAGGRVWSGKRALDVKLIDRIGGLADAVKEAARLAGMDNTAKPELLYLPVRKTWIDFLFDGEVNGMVSVMADTLVGQYVTRFFPVVRLPGSEPARMLMHAHAPQLMLMQPFEVQIE